MGSKKRTPEHRAEMAARAARRAERADRQVARKIDLIAGQELANRIMHDHKMDGLNATLTASGTVGKRAHVTGTPSNSEVPLDEDGDS